ncbi:MAG: HAMP domain-containing protein, partial [Actinomycetes bacterium]
MSTDETPQPRRVRASLRTQILAAFAVGIVALGSAGVVAVVTLKDQGATAYHAVHDVAEIQVGIHDLGDALWEVRAQGLKMRAMEPAEIPAAWSEQQGLYATFEESYAEFAAAYESLYGVPVEGAEDAGQLWEQYKAAQWSVYDLTAQQDPVPADERARLGDALVDAVRGLNAQVAEQIDTAALDDQAQGRDAVIVIVVLLTVGVALALAGALWLSHRITRAAAEVKAALEALAEGDLTHEARVRSRDEMGDMAASLAVAQGSLRE